MQRSVGKAQVASDRLAAAVTARLSKRRRVRNELTGGSVAANPQIVRVLALCPRGNISPVGRRAQDAAAARPRPRPRFELSTAFSPSEAKERVERLLEENDDVSGMVMEGRIELTIPPPEQHLWSPQLTIDIEESADSGSTLRARFGPHPHVWTMYMAGFAILLTGAMVSAVFGFSQWVINHDPWAFWLTPVFGILAALVFGAAFVGQGLSSEQMYLLRSFLTHAIEAEAPGE